MARIAEETGRHTRVVQRALATGDLPGHRRVGRVTTSDDLAVRAWGRSVARGRRWTRETTDAALDILTEGSTERLRDDARSRLHSRLRQMDARQIAHAAGGLTGWARYRGTSHGLEPVGPSVQASNLGLVAGDGWLSFVQVTSLDDFELDHDVALDPDGNLGVVERSVPDRRVARVLLDTYLLGDARQADAAARELEQRARQW